MNAIFIFGIIFLVMTFIAKFFMQKKVNNPSCPEDVKHVKENKKYFKIFLIISIVFILVGILLMIV